MEEQELLVQFTIICHGLGHRDFAVSQNTDSPRVVGPGGCQSSLPSTEIPETIGGSNDFRN